MRPGMGERPSEFPNLKVERVKNAAGVVTEYFSHRITGRSYGTNRERALRLWAADQLALDGPEGRTRVPGTVYSSHRLLECLPGSIGRRLGGAIDDANPHSTFGSA